MYNKKPSLETKMKLIRTPPASNLIAKDKKTQHVFFKLS